MIFENHLKTSKQIFDSFPNENIRHQGGIKPNRQIQKPEAGYCIVFKFNHDLTDAISHFMTKIHSLLPNLVEYKEQVLHMTIGTFGKNAMEKFVPDPAVLQRLMDCLEKGLVNPSLNIRIKLGEWLYNDEAILVSGYPNRDFWQLCQNIGNAFQKNGLPLESGKIFHITTTRFIHNFTDQEFDKFRLLMKSAPILGCVKPAAVELATWDCDGLTFNLLPYKRIDL